MKRRILAILLAVAVLFTFTPALADEITEEQPAEEAVVLNVHASAYDSESVTLSWDDSYEGEYAVYRYKDGEYYEIGRTEDNSYCIKDLTAGVRYKVAVSAGEYMEKISVCAKPNRVTSVKGKRMMGKKGHVTWSMSGTYSGFEIRYSKTKDFADYDTATSTKKSIDLKGLSRDTVYYVKVRAYRTASGKKYYGRWSSAKSFRYNEMYKKNGIFYIDGLMIANKTYSLPSTYGSGLKSSANSAFKEMKAAAAKDGINLYIASGYRSYQTQKYVYGNYASQWGSSIADIFSARAGHSEHQTGYAMDLNIVKDYFADTKEAKWLNKNCYKYGFIIRYPKGKTDETGYKYEPWHVRYVGKSFAKKLYNKGDWLTMEDYFNITSKY